MNDTILEMRNITKYFPGVKANDNINLDLKKGEIHAIVGENGAGKSTLMKILYGLVKPDHGDILLYGKPIKITNPHVAIKYGIGMVHQHFMLIPNFTVLENIIIGFEDQNFGILDFNKSKKKLENILKDFNCEINLNAIIDDLPVGLQQKVEILKILYRNANILIFDEPTAILTPQETKDLFTSLKNLSNLGKSIIFISHKLDEILEISDRITILRKGTVIKTINKNEATREILAELMVGKPVSLKINKPPKEFGEYIFKINNLTYINEKGIKVLNNLSFHIRKGEIYGLAGVEGNGQSELLSIIAGRLKPTSGEIIYNGINITNKDTRSKKEMKISQIPEDRQKQGLILVDSIADNIVFGKHHKKPFVNALQFRNFKQIFSFSKKIINEYKIKTSSEKITVNTLSGGNQQKVLIARELSANPKLLIAAQPTRGVDIGAIEFIHNRLIEERNNDVTILLISSDLDEIINLSDRIGVIYKGKIVKEFEKDFIKEKIGFYMTGENNENEQKKDIA